MKRTALFVVSWAAWAVAIAAAAHDQAMAWYWFLLVLLASVGMAVAARMEDEPPGPTGGQQQRPGVSLPAPIEFPPYPPPSSSRDDIVKAAYRVRRAIRTEEALGVHHTVARHRKDWPGLWRELDSLLDAIERTPSV